MHMHTQRGFWLTAQVIGIATAVACTVAESVPAPQPPPERASAAALEHARAFQVEYDRELREDDHSFLTVVAAYYLAPSEQLTLAFVDGAWARSDAAGPRFEVTGEQLRLSGMDDTDPTQLSAATLIPAGDDGRFAFAVSPQGESWRVQIHDRDAEQRTNFPGIAWFPLDPALIMVAHFEAAPTREPIVLQTSRGVTKTLYIVGEAQFEIDGQPRTLQAFGYTPEATPDEPLLIPFRDTTSGHQSYTAGRYLEPTAPHAGELELDFNRATNPLCAYSEHFNCPVPPRFNTLDLPIQAGAMAPEAGHETPAQTSP